MTSPADDTDRQVDELVEVALPAVRVIVGVVMRSLDASPVPVTVAQYRMLATMAELGPTRSATLAGLLDVDASTITRMSDRLVRDGLVVRRTERADRRAVRIALSAKGTQVVEAVAARRREEFASLLRAIPASKRARVVAALEEIEAANATLPAAPAKGWIA
jgi:DNA-binding MarR family transcriptional regulator